VTVKDPVEKFGLQTVAGGKGLDISDLKYPYRYRICTIQFDTLLY